MTFDMRRLTFDILVEDLVSVVAETKVLLNNLEDMPEAIKAAITETSVPDGPPRLRRWRSASAIALSIN
jgi:hypothetical protein